MKRLNLSLTRFKRDKFCRLTVAAIAGVMLAHLLVMPCSMVFVGMFPASIILMLDRFSLRRLCVFCATLMAGLTAGTLVIECFLNSPYLATLCTYAVFLGILKLFSRNIAPGECYFFLFSYVLATISGSYADAIMELSITCYYFIQLTLVFLIVWGVFTLFPAEKPRIIHTARSAAAAIPDYELMIHGLIWLAIWLFFMYFEWRFALFAFLSFMGAFRQFERTAIKRVAFDNILVHLCCCSVAALFSMVLFGMAGNPILLLLGVTLVVSPFTYLAVYREQSPWAYRYRTSISAILVPLILYLSTEHAAVYQSFLRAGLIVFLMIILYLAVEYLYYGVKVSERLQRTTRLSLIQVKRRQGRKILLGFRRISCLLPTK